MKTMLCLLALLCGPNPQAHARQGRTSPPTTNNADTLQPRPRNDAAVERTKALRQVHAFVDRAQELQDITLRVNTLASLAAILWKEGKDPEYARQIFIKTHDSLKSTPPQEVRDAPVGPAPAARPSSALPTKKTLRLLRKRLLTNLAQFDPALADRLAKEEDGFLETPLDAKEYEGQSREQTDRQRFNELSGANHIGADEAIFLLSLLDDFRKRDLKSGDELFLTVLSKLRGHQNVEANTVLIIGNYLFSGHPLPSNERISRIMVSPVTVGAVSLRADVVLNRDNMSPSLVRPYLTAAAEILSRSVENVEEQRRYSAAALLLASKAKEFAPDLVATFAAVAQRSDAGFVATEPDKSVVKRWNNEKIDVEAALSHIRKTVGTKERDRSCLSLAAQYCAQNDLDAAARVANEITDEALRNKLLGVIDFKRASRHLSEGDLARAEQTAARISPEPIRALAYIGLSASYLKGGKKDLASTAVDKAIADARRSTEEMRRPSLLISAAAALSPVDAPRALDLLREALKELDAADSSGPRPDVFEPGWVEAVTVEGGRPSRFELRPQPRPASYQQLLRTLYAADRSSVVSAVLGVRNEALLGSHLISLSRVLLEEPRGGNLESGSVPRRRSGRVAPPVSSESALGV